MKTKLKRSSQWWQTQFWRLQYGRTLFQSIFSFFMLAWIFAGNIIEDKALKITIFLVLAPCVFIFFWFVGYIYDKTGGAQRQAKIAQDRNPYLSQMYTWLKEMRENK